MQDQIRPENQLLGQQVKQAAGIFLSTLERSKTSFLNEFKIHFEHLQRLSAPNQVAYS